MKNFKIKILALVATAIIFSAGIVKAENSEPSTINDLNIQIRKELVDLFKSPVSLNFQDKNLNGETEVVITVEKNGKIVLKSVDGENNVLKHMISDKIESLNLWTDIKYAGKNFSYRLVSMQESERD